MSPCDVCGWDDTVEEDSRGPKDPYGFALVAKCWECGARYETEGDVDGACRGVQIGREDRGFRVRTGMFWWVDPPSADVLYQRKVRTR